MASESSNSKSLNIHETKRHPKTSTIQQPLWLYKYIVLKIATAHPEEHTACTMKGNLLFLRNSNQN